MTAPAVAAEQPVTPCKPLTYSCMSPAECRRNTWQVVVAAGTSVEQLLQPATWPVLADRLNQLDILECIWADHSAFATLLVLRAGRGHASVHLLSYHQLPAILTTDAGQLPVGFDISWIGPIQDCRNGYRVLRTVDQVVISEGHSTFESARDALLSHASLR